MFTLFILPGDNPEKGGVTRAINSASKFSVSFVVLKDRKLHDVVVTTPWYGYLYDNEFFDEALQEAISIFLKETTYDGFSIYQKKEGKVYHSPRIFRKYVKIKEGTLVPENPEVLNWERILNGWIIGT